MPGGGRINHDSANKKIFVYGYSMSKFSNPAYGLAKHEKTVELLKSEYPDYEIIWSNEGY